MIFLQLVLVNMLVSCDNIGVIALATRGLEPKKAASARRLGIWLSVLLKLLFVAVVGYLIGITWLHIRIVGGLLLLYVTFSMVSPSNRSHHKALGSEHAGRDRYLLAVVTIVAADISMSLDNVIAILSIVSSQSGEMGLSQMLLVLASLLVCVPLLLWLGEALARLMERHAILISLCGGYLAYTAVEMIFKDELLLELLEHIGFYATAPMAVLIGVLMTLYGCLHSPESTVPAKKRNALLSICLFVTAYSLLSAAILSFVSQTPVVHGIPLSAERLYGFTPWGANAVLTIAAASEFPVICSAVYVGILLRHSTPGERFADIFKNACKGMILFTLLELLITSVALTYTFGFGPFRPLLYLSALLVQVALLCSYTGIFCLAAVWMRNPAACVAAGIAILWVEDILRIMMMHVNHGGMLLGLLPGYYLELLPLCREDPVFVARALLLSALYLGLAFLLGSLASGKRVKAKLGYVS